MRLLGRRAAEILGLFQQTSEWAACPGDVRFLEAQGSLRAGNVSGRMPTLEVREITMEFPAVRALDGVSLDFRPGEVHGIVGENGAGKSTLMKILSGVQHPTAGAILLDGQAVAFQSVRDALDRGIAMIHQELNLVDELNVAENVFLGRELTRLGMLDRSAMIEKTRADLAEVGATCSPTDRVGELSIAGKQFVEIAKAIGVDASILIMDEPTAVLSEHESEALFELIGRLQAKGVTVLYISHRLAEVCRICDRITVLRDGKLVATVERGRADAAELARLMVGRELTDVFPPKSGLPAGDPILEVQGLSVPGYAEDVSFSVRPGEILGLAGLVGAGRTELCEGLIGARARSGGAVRVEGKPVSIRSPRDAMAHGIAYVSEDRKGLGLHLGLSVVANVTLANLRSYGSVLLDHRAERASAESWKQKLDIRAGDLEAAALYLSGGNQQKVSIAKWLDCRPRILILDEPTRGVDVGAKRELYLLIQQAAAQGLACVVISSELLEIIGLCHRTIVMREGRMMGELGAEQMSEESIMHLAAGVDAA